MRPQIGLRVAKALSFTINESKFFSGKPPLSYSVEKRRDPPKNRDFGGGHAS